MRYLICVLLISISLQLCSSANVYANTQQNEDVKQQVSQLFNKANDLLEAQKYPEALVEFKKCIELSPDDTSILFNAGMAAFFSKDYQLAANYWHKLKELDPDDWQARSKLVQTYQALGDNTNRDAEIKALYQLRSTNAELAKVELFCREQFEVADKHVMVFEHFELKGERAVKYYFAILLPNQTKEDYHISLGSYDLTNEVWAEQAKPKNNQRLYHLDKYFGQNHETYGFFTPEPAYDDIRALVIRVIEGKEKPLSGTYVKPEKNDK